MYLHKHAYVRMHATGTSVMLYKFPNQIGFNGQKQDRFGMMCVCWFSVMVHRGVIGDMCIVHTCVCTHVYTYVRTYVRTYFCNNVVVPVHIRTYISTHLRRYNNTCCVQFTTLPHVLVGYLLWSTIMKCLGRVLWLRWGLILMTGLSLPWKQQGRRKENWWKLRCHMR